MTPQASSGVKQAARVTGVLGLWCLATAAAPATATTEADLGPRNYTQRAANKIRSGSLLKSEGAEVRAAYVDLQGELGHRRDTELETHYARLAEMDVIAELGAKYHNVTLAERVETVRRKELERFFTAMQAIRIGTLLRAADPAGSSQAAGATARDEKKTKQAGGLRDKPLGSIYRQAADAARQRLTVDDARTRLDELDAQIETEREMN